MAPIRFAILAELANLEPWQLRCIEELLRSADVNAVALITPGAIQSKADLGPAGTPTTVVLEALPVVALTDDQSLARLEEFNLDFILSWGDVVEPITATSGAHPPRTSGAAASRSLLTVARYGVWRCQFGDWLNFRGAPAGFWEVHEHQSVSAAMLVRVQQDPDSVVVLREAYLRTNLLSAGRNRSQLEERFARWAAQLCVDIRNGVLDRLTAAPRRTTATIRVAPAAG